jgi:cytochrome c553
MPDGPVRCRRLFSFAPLLRAAIASAFLAASSALFAADLTGEQLFREKCASCHGATGEGVTDGYAKPLLGDRPLAELAKLIDDTMPEGEPETFSAEDSAKVAAYIYDAFYSPDAQARNRPPRVELSRLTVRQYMNAVADLAGSFTGVGTWNDERGLKAEYYNDRRTRRDKRVIERRDPIVDFNFGTASPDAEKIEPHQFAIEWEGSILAPETGEYEFVVRSEHAVRLWVNDPERPFIDAYVKSGDDTEYRQKIRLLGGRVYLLRMEFSKATQGVNDQNKDKEKPPAPASISLRWKRPHLPEEVIPERFLSPNEVPSVLVVETPFPPDDRSTGYERGSSISKEWDQATTYAAIEIAQKILDDLGRFAGARREDGDRTDKLREFCRRFVERAFRRPLSDELRQLVIDRQFEQAPDPETAVKRIILLTLKSPRFLYRDVAAGEPDGYDVAARLSFGLWDSLPDQQLLEAAANGGLKTREQILAQAERMIGDLRARAKLLDFMRIWLGTDRMQDLAKDASLYPGFDETVASDLRTSLDLFLEDVVFSEGSDFRRLLLDDSFYVNGRLAKLYGIDLPADAPFQKISFEPEHRAGVLSHPFLLTGYAYHGTSSPIHRGVFIARSVLGRTLMPPPEAVTPLAPDLHPDLTTRQRVELQTSPANCMTCHGMVNPLGFSLEQFDAIGRFRTEEKGRPIDPTGAFIKQTGETVTFTGARQLATALAGDPEVHEAFVEQLFRHVAKQPIRAYGPTRLSELTRSFADNNFSIRRLLAESVTLAATATDDSNTPETVASADREPVVAARPQNR